MSEERDNVIHVNFGTGGGSPPRRPPPMCPRRPSRRRDPLADLYTRREVARLFDVGEGRLRALERSGIVEPTARVGRRRFYTFQDLIGVRTALGLLARGVPLRRVGETVQALRRSLPRVARPLVELRVVTDGRSLVVRDDHGAFEPATGQGVLDFGIDALRRDVVRALRPAPSEATRRHAYELYLEGCRLDEDESTLERAERAYRRAIELDPTLASAITNLANLRHRLGDVQEAVRLYRCALQADPEQPEAAYNMGYVSLEQGDAEGAVTWFERALRVDPEFSDAHFNLALALETMGRFARARPHWQAYLELEPEGELADIARRQLRAPWSRG